MYIFNCSLFPNKYLLLAQRCAVCQKQRDAIICVGFSMVFILGEWRCYFHIQALKSSNFMTDDDWHWHTNNGTNHQQAIKRVIHIHKPHVSYLWWRCCKQWLQFQSITEINMINHCLWQKQINNGKKLHETPCAFEILPRFNFRFSNQGTNMENKKNSKKLMVSFSNWHQRCTNRHSSLNINSRLVLLFLILSLLPLTEFSNKFAFLYSRHSKKAKNNLCLHSVRVECLLRMEIFWQRAKMGKWAYFV